MATRPHAIPSELAVNPKRRKRLLIVDDDHATLHALGGVLREAGYTVDAAESGEAALARLRSEASRPDLVLLDLMMPGVDGWELTTRMREDAATRGLPIVVMSAGGAPLLATAPVVAGYLSKPLRMDQLLQIVDRTLTLHALRGSGRPPQRST
jgi:CheY-like chemotaxis protein